MVNLTLTDAFLMLDSSGMSNDSNGMEDITGVNNLYTQYTQINQSDFYKWNHVVSGGETTQDSTIYQIHETSIAGDPSLMQLTNSSHNNSSFSDSHDSNNTILNYAESIGDILVFYYTPMIVFVGIIGNILSVLVFFRTKLRKLSSSYYLAALGMSDTCFLVLSFITWLNFVDINLTNHNVACQLYYYLQGVCSFLSVWYVVAFTVERFIAVLYPLKRQSMCTVRRAVIVLCGLTVAALIFSAPLLYLFRPVYHAENNVTVCDVVEEYKVSKRMFFYFLFRKEMHERIFI